jgi:hypothetical protein
MSSGPSCLPLQFTNLPFQQGMEKVVPDQPTNSTPVHLRKTQIYAHNPILRGEPFIPEKTQSP